MGGVLGKEGGRGVEGREGGGREMLYSERRGRGEGRMRLINGNGGAWDGPE